MATDALNGETAPPEAALIRLVRLAAGLSVIDAAQKAGISKARWSQIETGRENRQGEVRAVVAGAGMLAHMGYAIGLDPDRLEAAGRADAAEVLREMNAPRFGDPEEQRISDEVWEANAEIADDPELRRGFVNIAIRMHRRKKAQDNEPNGRRAGNGA